MWPRASSLTPLIIGLSLAFSLARTADVSAADDEGQTAQPEVATSKRPERLRPLYISLAALQGLDVHSTKMALDRNPRARETNPILGSVGGLTVGMIVLKTTAAASTYYLSERLSKKNRKAAVWTMIGLNVGYGLIVANNYRIATSGTAER